MTTTNDAATVICAADLKAKIDPKQPLEDRIKDAFREAQNFWMSTDDNVRFNGAMAALYQTASDDEKELLKYSSQQLQKFSVYLAAVAAGVSADPESVIPDPDKKLLPLLGWWQESKKDPEE